MSRSRRKNPAGGVTTAKSDKEGKRADHKRYRAYAEDLVRKEKYDDICDRKIKECVWNWPKDGKIWYGLWCKWKGWIRK